MKLSVLVPFRPDGGWRDRSHDWNMRRLRATLPNAEVVVEGLSYEGDGAAHFSHSRAANRAAQRAGGDVFLIQDADTAFDPAWVERAARVVASGEAPWVLPTTYKQLARDATDALLTWPPDVPTIPSGFEYDWVGSLVSWAGLVVVPREAFELVAGYDERFTCWGADDVVLAMKLNTLWGACERLAGSATHLWHPRAGLDAQPQRQHDLMWRYLDAAGDREAMRRVSAL